MKKTNIITYFESNDYKGFEEMMQFEFEEDNRPIVEKNTDEYWSRFTDYEEMEWDCFMSNLKYSKFNKPCIVMGSLGLWNGRRDIITTKFYTIVDAINQITNVGYHFYITIKKVNGHLEITQSHHDGTHHFEIHMLNDRGNNARENADLSKRCYHKAMKGYLY